MLSILALEYPLSLQIEHKVSKWTRSRGDAETTTRRNLREEVENAEN
jgi:hypothetical protein